MYEVKVKDVSEQAVLRIRSKTTMSGMGQAMGEAFGRLGRFMGTKGIPFLGPPLCVYPEEFEGEKEAEIWCCFPAPPDATGEGDIEATVIPGGKVAWTVHRGPYDALGKAYEALSAGMQEQDRRPAGPMRDVYLTDPENVPPEEYVTEVQWPVG
jgi:effector-binding domain-containing protein